MTRTRAEQRERIRHVIFEHDTPAAKAFDVALLIVIVFASVGSHMPARFRYYSVIHRRVLD